MSKPLITALLLIFALPAIAADNQSIVRINDGDGAWRQRLGEHFGHLPRDRKRGEIVLQVDAADWRWLQTQGYAPRFDAALSAQLQTTLAKTIPGYSCYNTVEETDAFIDTQVSTHPTLASIVDIGDSWEKTSPGGLAGYDLRLLRISNSAVVEDKPKMMVMSGLQAREYTPVRLNLKFAEWLLANYGTNAEATWLVDHNEFHVLLQANPDGRKIAEGGSSQRKNRHYFGSCSGTGIGVDLNRNFPFYWNLVPGGSSGSLCSDTYRGPTPRSEPEAAAVDDYVTSIFPDARTGSENDLNDAANANTPTMFIDLHSYGGTILYPWGVAVTPTAAANDAAFKAMARRMTWFNNYDPGQAGSALYLTDGASDDNAYGKLGVPAFTWELGSSFFDSCTTFNSEWPGNLDALRYAARIVQAPYLRAAGPDVHTVAAMPAAVDQGTPVTISATATDARFNQTSGSETIQNIMSARAYVDVLPWQPGAMPIAMAAADGSFNSATEALSLNLATASLTDGRHVVYIEASDASGRAGAIGATFLQISGGLLSDGFE